MKLIPKILHLYWDLSNMSYLQTLTVLSFKKHNPNWEINIYIPHQGYKGNAKYIPDYKGPDFFHTLKNLSYINFIKVDLYEYNIDIQHHNILRSDILRYQLLYEYGGVWSDFDVLWFKPIDHFDNIGYHGNTIPDEITAVASFIQGTHGGHSVGIMIHSKNDPYVQSLVESTRKVAPPFSHEVFGGTMLHDCYPTLESIREKFPTVVGAKFETYYPYNIHPPRPTIQNLYYGMDLNPLDSNNNICLHWYNGHQFSKQYLNGPGINHKCSMTAILKREGYA